METLLILTALGAALWFYLRRDRPGRSSVDGAPPHQAPPPPPAATKPRAQAHIEAALSFAQQRQQSLEREAAATARWQQRFGTAALVEIDALDGVAFERYLAGLLRARLPS